MYEDEVAWPMETKRRRLDSSGDEGDRREARFAMALLLSERMITWR